MHMCAQTCPTPCDPMDCSPPGSSVHGILHAKALERVAMPSSRWSSWSRDRTGSPALQTDSLLLSPNVGSQLSRLFESAVTPRALRRSWRSLTWLHRCPLQPCSRHAEPMHACCQGKPLPVLLHQPGYWPTLARPGPGPGKTNTRKLLHLWLLPSLFSPIQEQWLPAHSWGSPHHFMPDCPVSLVVPVSTQWRCTQCSPRSWD